MAHTKAYYNEHDPFAAAWLRELIHERLIADGEVDERDIEEVRARELAGYTQCHFFAGIGGWSYALRLAGWPDDQPVWTGSCPCQPYSAAGKQQGNDDPRHLWPKWYRLIRQSKPGVVFGEQVAQAIGHGWLDLVSANLEAEGYAIGACVLGAHSVGAPHLRQRLYFVADTRCRTDERLSRSSQASSEKGSTQGKAQQRERGGIATRTGMSPSELGITQRTRLEGLAGHGYDGDQPGRIDTNATRSTTSASNISRVADPQRNDWGANIPKRQAQGGITDGRVGAWSAVEWLHCKDDKARPTQPGLFPLAHGVPNRLGALRGAGNAIVPQVAAAFIQAYVEVRR